MVWELRDHAKISLHNGKTKVWNRGGIAPVVGQTSNRWHPRITLVWRGDPRQGLLILGMLATMISSENNSVAAGKSTTSCYSVSLQSPTFKQSTVRQCLRQTRRQ